MDTNQSAGHKVLRKTENNTTLISLLAHYF